MSFLVISPENGNSWDLRRDKNGIKVYLRNVENSRFREVMAIAEFEFAFNKIDELLMDIPGQSKWMKDMKEIELLSDDPEKPIQYNLMEVSGPVSDRDVIVETHMSRSSGLLIRDFRSVEHELKPVRDGVVRIPDTSGRWVLEQLEENLTRVTYQNHTDPGGSLPAWLVNPRLVDQAYETLNGMRQYLEKEK